MSRFLLIIQSLTFGLYNTALNSTYKTTITLTRNFLTWIHSNPVMSSVKDVPPELAIESWSKYSDTIEIGFGGIYGEQFPTESDFFEFRTEFIKLLDTSNIDRKHEHALYYFITFYGHQSTAQSIQRNHYNTLLIEGRFLLDLIEDSTQYFKKLVKDPSYDFFIDPDTEAPLFIKKHLITEEEFLLDFAESYAKRPGDVIRFHRFLIYETVVYLRPHYNFNFTRNISKRDAKRKSIPLIELPGSLKLDTFMSILDRILNSQQAANTLFYREFNIEGGFDMRSFQQFSKGYYKQAHSHVGVMFNIATALSDYLKRFANFKSKTAIAKFIYGYFILFKAVEVKDRSSIPKAYSELEKFYTQQGRSFNYIRLLLKG